MERNATSTPVHPMSAFMQPPMTLGAQRNSYTAMDLEGEYAAGDFAPERLTKKGRVIIAGRLVYFVYAFFPPDDSDSRQAADYFLSTLKIFPGKKPPKW